MSCHWGISGSDETAEYQVDLAHAAVDSGADIVLGHGPHVIQGAEVYKGKPAFYSLGNFFFGWRRMPPDWVGLMVWAEVESGKLVRVMCSPVRPNAEGETTIRSVEEERDVMTNFQEACQRFGTTVDLNGERAVIWQVGTPA